MSPNKDMIVPMFNEEVRVLSQFWDPSIGRIVHYVDHDGSHLPAIIVFVWPSGVCNLQVFRNRAVPSTVWVTSRRQDPDGTPDTWHWPEQVPVQGFSAATISGIRRAVQSEHEAIAARVGGLDANEDQGRGGAGEAETSES